MKHATHSSHSCLRHVYEVVQNYPNSRIHQILLAVNNRQRMAGHLLSSEGVVRSGLMALRRGGFLKSRASVATVKEGKRCSVHKWAVTSKPISFTPSGRVTLVAWGIVRKNESRPTITPPAAPQPVERTIVRAKFVKPEPANAEPVKAEPKEALVSVPMLGERVTFTVPQARDLHRNLNAIFN